MNEIKKKITGLIAVILSASVMFGCAAVDAGKPIDITVNTKAEKPVETDISQEFIDSYYEFSLSLLKGTSEKDKNTLVSPLSVMLALGMTVNGADKDTRTEIESALGNIKTDSLNSYLYSYVKSLEFGNSKDTPKFHAANSIWMRNTAELKVNDSFLEKCSGYYKAEAYKVNFSNKSTVDTINSWVKKSTDGMIDKIADNFEDDLMVLIVNALAFEGEWSSTYEKNQVSDGVFTNADNTSSTVNFMSSNEYKYISGENAVGFVKNYKEKYAFAAILPNEGVEKYLENVTAEELYLMIRYPSQETVETVLPKFKYDFSVSLPNTLKAMGMKKAFDPADANLTKLGQVTGVNLYVSEVLHKTYIEVAEKGTKAGAVTAVMVGAGYAAPPEDPKKVILDRPFIYAIIDLENNLPIFIGTVQNLS